MRRFLATLTLICLLAAIEMIDSQAQPQPGSSTTDHKDELKSLIELGNTILRRPWSSIRISLLCSITSAITG